MSQSGNKALFCHFLPPYDINFSEKNWTERLASLIIKAVFFEGASMQFPWLSSYPPGVPAMIDISRYSSLMEIFDEAVRKFRLNPCFSNMGRTLSFEEMDRLSGDFASFLQHELGLKKGDRIALQMPNLLQYPIALFGALRAGLIVVNTNPLYTAKEMRHHLS